MGSVWCVVCECVLVDIHGTVGVLETMSVVVYAGVPHDCHVHCVTRLISALVSF